MKKTLLTLFTVLLAAVSTNAQEWQWGTATWNIEDGKVYDGIEDFNAEGVVLTYPNPADYALTFLNIVAIKYDLFVDDATEPIETGSSAQMSSVITLDYNFVEGHSYRVVTKGALLARANLATYTTDTLSTDDTSYTISFTINGPELVKTFDVEGTMSLSITNQEEDLTYSVVDTKTIKEVLGINDLSEANIYALAPNGSYVSREWHADYFYGWRDADGEYTHWGGGWNAYAGHNAYPAVYAVQLNETSDSIFYFFYDYWKEYDPEEPGEVPGSGTGAKRRAPETSYNSVIWDWEWDDEEGHHTTQYTRRYRVDEGKDYKAGFIYIANKKSVVVNATLHFVSQEDYASYLTAIEAPATAEVVEYDGETAIYNLNGTQIPALQKGVNIVRKGAIVKKVLVP